MNQPPPAPTPAPAAAAAAAAPVDPYAPSPGNPIPGSTHAAGGGSRDFVPVTPTRANTRPIYGAVIKPINEPPNRFEGFQYPPITTDGMGVAMLDGTLHQHAGHLQFRWSRYCEMRNGKGERNGTQTHGVHVPSRACVHTLHSQHNDALRLHSSFRLI